MTLGGFAELLLRGGTMSDLAKYEQARSARDPEFAEGLEAGYADLKICAQRSAANESAATAGEIESAGSSSTRSSTSVR